MAAFAASAVSRFQWTRDVAAIAVATILVWFAVLIWTAPESRLVYFLRPSLEESISGFLLEQTDADLIALVERMQRHSDVQLEEYGFSSEEILELRGTSAAQYAHSMRVTEADAKTIAEIVVPILAEYAVNRRDYKRLGFIGRNAIASILFAAVLAAIISDVLVVLATRKLLRLGARTTSLHRFVLLGICSLLLVVVLFVTPIVLGSLGSLPYRFNACFALVATMNWSVVPIAFSSSIIGVVLVGNRMIWPTVATYFDNYSTVNIDRLRKHCRWLWMVTLGIAAEMLGVNWISFLFQQQ